MQNSLQLAVLVSVERAVSQIGEDDKLGATSRNDLSKSMEHMELISESSYIYVSKSFGFQNSINLTYTRQI